METTLETIPSAAAEVNHALEAQEKIQFLRQMLRIRRFEQAALKQYQTSGQIGGFLHLCIGQESVAVGTMSLCGDDDHIITGYRNHGHALAAGMSMNECMAELFGKVTGCSKGKGGSMHYFAPDKNFWGGHGIVAGQTPLGLGLAFALKYKGIKGCCLCYIGDGAVNQGVYQASLNLASLWSLPVIYVIENNQYSMGTSQERSSAYRDCLAARAEAYDIEWDRFNGEDIYEVRAKTLPAILRAREKSRPTVLEIATYRYYGHSVSDANAKKYRSPEEVEKYRKLHDPIQLWQERLLDEGVLTAEQAEELNAAATTEAAESVRFAQESPLPEKTDIFADVYCEVDRQTAAGRTGKFFFND